MSTLRTIPLFGLGVSGKSATVSAQSCTNFYREAPDDADKSRMVFYPAPCMTSRATLASGPEHLHYWPTKGYVVAITAGATIYTFDGSTATNTSQSIPTISGSVPDQYDTVDGGGTLLVASWLNSGTGAIQTWTGSGAPTARTFPTGVTAFGSVTWLDGYYIGTELSSGRFWLSDLEDPSTWNDANFATAESSPDNLTRGIAYAGRLMLIGERSIEFWQNTGAASFPFQPIRGATMPFGSPARKSISMCAAGIFMLSQQQGGKKQIMLLSNNGAKAVSNQELETILEGYTTVSDARSFAYQQSGHTFYQITFPSHSASWLYDLNTNTWSKRTSPTGGGTHAARMGVEAFGKVYVTTGSTSILELQSGAYVDAGTEPARQLISRHIFGDYNRMSIDEVYVDIEPISGAPQNATIGLSVSRDGGLTYATEQKVTLASTATRAVWRRLGRARDFVLKFNFPGTNEQGENTGNKWVVLGGAIRVSK